jgi:hypothetical protein
MKRIISVVIIFFGISLTLYAVTEYKAFTNNTGQAAFALKISFVNAAVTTQYTSNVPEFNNIQNNGNVRILSNPAVQTGIANNSCIVLECTLNNANKIFINWYQWLNANNQPIGAQIVFPNEVTEKKVFINATGKHAFDLHIDFANGKVVINKTSNPLLDASFNVRDKKRNKDKTRIYENIPPGANGLANGGVINLFCTIDAQLDNRVSIVQYWWSDAAGKLIGNVMHLSYSLPQFGPGPNWLVDCGPDQEIMTTRALVGINLHPFNCNLPPDFTLELNGPIEVSHTGSLDIAPSGPCGSATVDDQFDVIQTEMLSMNLTGSGYTLVAGAPGNPDLPQTLGAMLELESDNTKACSFFEVYFKIITPFGTFYNHDPLVVKSIITTLPPLNGTVYLHPENLCLLLYPTKWDVPSSPVITLVSAEHTIVSGGGEIPHIIPTLSQWGLIIFSFVLLSIGIVYIVKRRRLSLIINTE